MCLKISLIISVVLIIVFLLVWYFSEKSLRSNSIASNNCTTMRDFTYPVARRDDSVVDDFHGTKVADPYRWLEDPDSEETKQYVEAENKIAQPFLENCDKWQKINTKLTALWNYPKYTVPDRHGKYYFSYMNTGLQNQKYLFKFHIFKINIFFLFNFKF